jgi:hypothetical protein
LSAAIEDLMASHRHARVHNGSRDDDITRPVALFPFFKWGIFENSPHVVSWFTFDHDAVFYGVALLLWDAGSSDLSGTRKRAASMSAIGAAIVIARTLLNVPE